LEGAQWAERGQKGQTIFQFKSHFPVKILFLFKNNFKTNTFLATYVTPFLLKIFFNILTFQNISAISYVLVRRYGVVRTFEIKSVLHSDRLRTLKKKMTKPKAAITQKEVLIFF
jgi:hypothetical protein